MNERIQIVIATVAVFLGGLLVGVWTQRTPPMPPPPMRVMGEFRGPRGEMFSPWLGGGPGQRPIDPAEMQRQIAALRPQFAAFHGQVHAIERSFRSQFEHILKPNQKAYLLDMIAKHERRSSAVLPGCAGEMGHPFVTMVIYRPVLERLTAKLGLDQAQQAQLRTLLIERRKQLLDLVDSTPPPSFQLGSIVPPPSASGTETNPVPSPSDNPAPPPAP